VLKESAHVLVANEVNRIAFHHLLVFLNVKWINHAPNKTAWLNIELKLEITANDVWIEIESLKCKNVIEWEVHFEFHWVWKTVLKLSNIDVSTANRWRIDRNIFIKTVNILSGLLFIAWLKSAISETLTAALVLLITSAKITAENLELVENLVRGLKADEKLAEMVLISKRWIDACKLEHQLNSESEKTVSNL
jgi:hypothetical protein